MIESDEIIKMSKEEIDEMLIIKEEEIAKNNYHTKQAENDRYISCIKKGIATGYYLKKLYDNNIRFAVIKKNLHRNSVIKQDEYLQEAYLALDVAIQHYNIDSKYSFLSYYNVCLTHNYYKLYLNLFFNMKLNRTIVKKCNLKQFISLELDDYSAMEVDDKLNQILNSYCIKEILSQILNKKDLDLLYDYKINYKDCKYIAKSFNIKPESVQQRIYRIFQKLRRDKRLLDFYNNL